MTQEFHLSVTPVRENEYLVRTEDVAPGVPLAEEQVIWSVEDWLTEASLLMDDPLLGLLGHRNLPSGFNSASLRSSTGEIPAINLATFGQRLYSAVFQGTIRDSWMTAQGIAQHRRERLRLRLGLKGTRLHRLPWEVLYAGDRPLATGTDVVFSRYHSSFSIIKSHLSDPKIFTNESPHILKILMVLAVPADQDALALKQEAEQLKQELQASSSSSHLSIDLTILEQPGREQLTQALEHNHYHVLHYAGHSNLSAAGGSLYLVNRRTGLSEVLSGDDLAGLLVNNGIRMAVFNSCRGGYTAAGSSSEAEGNLAEALVKRGIPAVLVMAERIPDEVALNLSRLFYRNLKQGYPVDLSLSRSRQGLISSYGSDQLYWALPILYLHPKFDGYLQPTPASVVNHGMSLDAPSSSGLYDGSDADLPQLRAPELTIRHEVEISDEDDLLYFDDWEFEDIRLPVEEDDVIKLANALEKAKEFEHVEEQDSASSWMDEVSHSPTVLEPDEPLLPNPFGEDLLSDGDADTKSDDYWLPNSPSLPPSDESGGYSNHASALFSDRTTTATIAQLVDVKVYSELETVLAEMGTLTSAIATANRAVQANPTSATAHINLGWVYYQQGYLAEAIAAYQQALQLDFNSPLAYNRLGLALYQQGNLSDAVQAYTHAVELDPHYTDASNNLKALLYRPSVSSSLPAILPVTSPAKSATVTPIHPTADSAATLAATKPKQRSLFWLGSGLFALSALLTSWVFHAQILEAIPSIPLKMGISLSPKTSSNENDLSQTSSAALVTLATDQISQGNIDLAQPAIELLLDRHSRKEAEIVLNTVSSKDAANPTFNFLKGRLAWELWLAGDRTYSIRKARQFWDAGLKVQPNPPYQNALGFAYYAEGKFNLAEQAWLQALILSGEKPVSAKANPALNPVPNRETLQSYAGLALVSLKLADNQPPEKQAAARSVAMKLRQKIVTADPVNFTPAALRLTWMWSEKTIQDWELVLATK
ncbi:CHAT domain-containing protein [Phormidium sp. CLA17]|uniref:CHAT domain-containing protein n=1 Tax=Leptolyngbya sp. Cla-17 TaxID=2803751 RepID=UPI0014929DEF|nr:CHAT domain-containing protein [Leptolyngbya sp. Cla-17]MBM0740386.1 CHAT domain-containing protein [Leptolyngbya sp. Cla-17]